jgi:hypothetical protein
MRFQISWTDRIDATIRQFYSTATKEIMTSKVISAGAHPMVSWDQIRRRASALKVGRLAFRNAPKGSEAAKQRRSKVVRSAVKLTPQVEPAPFIVAPNPQGVSLFNRQACTEFRIIEPGEADTAHEKHVAALNEAWSLLWRDDEPYEVARRCRLPLREVYRLVGEVREAKRKKTRTAA